MTAHPAQAPTSQSIPAPLLVGSLAVSVVACIFLFWLIYGAGGSEDLDLSFLAPLNALLNSLSAVCLTLGYLAIRKGQREKHRRLMLSALTFSALFLVSYIVYHFAQGDTPFTGSGPIRTVYFTVLISHIVLSVVALPLVLITSGLGLTGRYPAHRRVARWTFPLWLYVSVTGVAIFWLLKLFG